MKEGIYHMPETKLIFPVVPLRDMVVYPHILMNLDVGRKASIEALRHARPDRRYIIMVTQRDGDVEEPTAKDVFEVGTLVEVKQMMQLPGNVIRTQVEGISRVTVTGMTLADGYLQAEAVPLPEETPENRRTAEAYRRHVLKKFFEWAEETKANIPDEHVMDMRGTKDLSHVVDLIALHLPLSVAEGQYLLQEEEIMTRATVLDTFLDEEIEIGKLEMAISLDARNRMDKEQRDYYLRQKIKSIHDELGDEVSQDEEAEEYKELLDKTPIPEEYKAKLGKEISHLATMPPMMAETTVIRNYLECLFALPWGKESRDNLDLSKAETILNKAHYGLEKVKERILEYLAVRILAPDAKAPILCFVGPPGVGKTSFAESIAKCLGKKFVRISLGGIHDEAEIRGHRRTYIGAMPGRFISAISQAKTKNPVILLDELDKVGSDFRGDPASALLEALDPEQNKAFHDNYVDIPFDLSKVFFVATANTVSTIPPALLDRMEVIELTGYTEEEKISIAKKYLVPRQRKRNGLTTADISFSDALLKKIIRLYTREAGVRNLERTIESLCRKVGKKKVLHDETLPKLHANALEDYLGPAKFLPEADLHDDKVGRVNGLAWTVVGGEVLDTEAVTIKGKGNLILTGQLGDVMKESAETAYTYIRSRAKDLGLKDNFYETLDTHIHLPEGAVPKDGPSAGITMATAMASAYTGRKVRGDTAMTGEITLTGDVLPIGGVKEKVLAAGARGIKQILLPAQNKRDLEEIPENIRKKLTFIYVKNVDDVLKHALMK